MQARFCRAPNSCRVVKSVPTVTIQSPAGRNMSLFSHAHPFFRGGFFPGAVSAQPVSSLYSNEIAPLFRLLDDYASSATRAFDSLSVNPSSSAGRRLYQPRFDVREVDNTYELRGELPGVEQKDIEIEFTDSQTLVVRGQTERESSTAPNDDINASVATPAAVENENTAKVTQDDDAVSTHSDSSYHKATVEDAETGELESTSNSGFNTPATATEVDNNSTSAAQPAAVSETQAQPQSQTQAQAQQNQYWVSERSVGSFQRVFQFQAPVNHEAVKASLRNGILSVSVPKLEQTVRRINIQ